MSKQLEPEMESVLLSREMHHDHNALHNRVGKVTGVTQILLQAFYGENAGFEFRRLDANSNPKKYTVGLPSGKAFSISILLA